MSSLDLVMNFLNLASITIWCSPVGLVAVPVEVAEAGRFFDYS